MSVKVYDCHGKRERVLRMELVLERDADVSSIRNILETELLGILKGKKIHCFKITAWDCLMTEIVSKFGWGERKKKEETWK